MSRGFGEIEFVGEQVPEWIALLAAVLTRLGDLWFLLVVLLAVFVVAEQNRPDVAALLGLTIGSIGLYRGLKHAFEWTRPESSPLESEGLHVVSEAMFQGTVTVGGYGFPSGHATMATIVYLGLASSLAVGSRRQRFATAVAIIGAVSLTRIVLQVHYLADVLAGMVIGAILVGAVFVLPRKLTPEYRATLAQAVAVPLCGLYYVTSGGATDSIILLTGALALLAGWQFITLYSLSWEADRYRLGGTLPVLRVSTGALAAGALTLIFWQSSTVPTDPSSSAVQATAAAILILLIPVGRTIHRRLAG